MNWRAYAQARRHRRNMCPYVRMCFLVFTCVRFPIYLRLWAWLCARVRAHTRVCLYERECACTWGDPNARVSNQFLLTCNLHGDESAVRSRISGVKSPRSNAAVSGVGGKICSSSKSNSYNVVFDVEAATLDVAHTPQIYRVFAVCTRTECARTTLSVE